jgi:hypothetical protein
MIAGDTTTHGIDLASLSRLTTYGVAGLSIVQTVLVARGYLSLIYDQRPTPWSTLLLLYPPVFGAAFVAAKFWPVSRVSTKLTDARFGNRMLGFAIYYCVAFAFLSALAAFGDMSVRTELWVSSKVAIGLLATFATIVLPAPALFAMLYAIPYGRWVDDRAFSEPPPA